uniref:Uncharacterized protein n=1 Tax=Polynucleobacter necessarius subsp. necessarius (strain STIR1) TaxID=452638 RepID=B1XTP9_POLNS
MLKKVAFAAVPTGNAWAAPTKIPEGSAVNELISKVAAGTVVPTAQNLDLNAFLQTTQKRIAMVHKLGIRVIQMAVRQVARFLVGILECG